MKKNYNIITGLIVVAVVTMGVMFLFVNKQQKESSTILSEIFPDATIQTLEGVNHYNINSSEYYTHELKVGQNKVFLVIENYENQGSIYRFYSFDLHPKLLKEVNSLIPVEILMENFEKSFFVKDITGDGLEELFIAIQYPGSSPGSYVVLQWDEGSLVEIKITGTESGVVEFDEITYESGYVYMTWHGTYEQGKIRYEFKNKSLVEIKNIGSYKILKEGIHVDGECEIKETTPLGEEKILDKGKCEMFGTNFDQFF